MKKKSILAVVLALCLLLSLCACTGEKPDLERSVIRVATLKGPAGIGMVRMMEQNQENKTANQYEFTLCATPAEVTALVSNGSADVAAVPINMAATLYNKTGKKIKMAAAGTTGVLYILENGNSIHSLEDLKGKTLYATGQGATPEYILSYLLKEKGITPGTDVKIEYLGEHAELAAKAASGQVSLCMLPEPFVSSLLTQNSNFRIALDMSAQWKKLKEAGKDMGELAQTGIIVRTDFLDGNKAALDKFLEEYEASVKYVTDNVSDAAKLVETFQILPGAAVAEKAIPNLGLVYIGGAAMKTGTEPFFKILFDLNPQSVGGALPDEGFYYQK